MAGIKPKQFKGPLTFIAEENIIGGTWVAPVSSTSERVQTAATASTTAVGIALGDASAYDFANADTTDAWGNPVTNAHYPPPEVAVAYQGIFILKNVHADTAIAFGGTVGVGTDGVGVLPNTTAAQIVGRCVQPGGIAAGESGAIRIGGTA